MKGVRDLTKESRTTKEKHDDYFRFTINNMTPDDSGTYSVVVKNKFGIDRSFISVRVSVGDHSLAISVFLPLSSFNGKSASISLCFSLISNNSSFAQTLLPCLLPSIAALLVLLRGWS